MISSENLRPTPNPARKALGKLANRVEEVKNPWRQGSTLEFSHNETARLATDALLEHGEKEYKKVLHDEREVNFLSSLEIRYITENVAKSGCADSGTNGVDMEEGDTVSELTSGTYFPMMSDEEPPMLELGWPEASNRFGPTEAQIYFQRDKSKNVKDHIRSLINKAKKVRTTETHSCAKYLADAVSLWFTNVLSLKLAFLWQLSVTSHVNKLLLDSFSAFDQL